MKTVPMRLFRDASARCTEGALYLCIALALSFLESLVPTSLVIPLAGFKLGLCNISVTAAYFASSPLCAFCVSVLRVFVSSLLFGNPTSFVYSLSGALLSFVALVLLSVVFNGKISFVGISAVCGAFHNIGQLIPCAFVFSPNAALSLLPLLTFCGFICGTVTGCVLSALPYKVFSKRRKT